jgi:NCAIR mutase (PurE)-related protein
LLSIKFTSKSLEGITTHSLFKEVLEDSFERKKEYEITGVQKNASQDFVWIVAPTPNQAKKIREYKIRAQQEVLQGVVTKAEATRKRNATLEQRAKRDCLKLVVYNLPPTKITEMIAHAIKEKMEEKNVVDIFFHNSDGEKHSGKANSECLSPIVYRQYLDKTIAMLGKYIGFTPHPRSLEGTVPPTEEDIKKFGFCDNNQALVDTLEAVQNALAPSSSITKEDIVAIVEGVVENGNKRLKMEMHKEMDSLKETMVKQANTYAEQLTDNLKTELEDVKNALEIALVGLRNIT